MRSPESHHPEVQNEELPFLSVTVTGGGPFVIGWGLGMARRLQEEGIPISDAELMGTSAGGWVVGGMAAGKSIEEISNRPQMKIPDRSEGLIEGYARDVFGNERAENMRTIAVRKQFLIPEKLKGDKHYIYEMVAATSAVPGFFRSAKVRGREYFDGGVRSVGNLDIAPRAKHMLGLVGLGSHLGLPLPFIGRDLPVGFLLHRQSKRETELWERRHGGELTVVQPNASISKMIRHPKHLFDFGIAVDAHGMGWEQGGRVFANNEHLQRIAGEAAIRRSQLGA